MISFSTRHFAALSLAGVIRAGAQTPAPAAVSATAITFTNHDGQAMRGKLVLPATRPRAIVIYVQTAEAMTVDMKRPDGRGGSFNYFDLYRSKLPGLGIGFFSYDGRGVRLGDSLPRYEAIDTAAYNTSTLSNQSRDVIAAINAVRAQPRLATVPVILLGASEGTLIAAEAAARVPGQVQGLALYAVMSENMRETFRYIMTGGAFTTYRTKFDANGDGRISLAEFEADPVKYRARVWRNAPFSTFDRDGDGLFTVDEMRFLTGRYLDAIDAEAFPVLDQWAKTNASVSVPANWFRDHFSHADLWSYLSSASMPVGLFQGELDAMVSPAALRRIEAKAQAVGKRNFEFHFFRGLDHALDIDRYFVSGVLPTGHEAIFAFIDRIASGLAEGKSAHGKLQSLAFLEGTWIGRTEGEPPSVHVEVRYFWGPTGRLLHFETNDLSTGRRVLLYEGHVQCDAKEAACRQFNVKPNGEINQFAVEIDSSGFTAIGANTRSAVKRLSNDTFEWQLRANVGGQWKDIMTAPHRRIGADSVIRQGLSATKPSFTFPSPSSHAKHQ